MNPLISIILPTFERPKSLKKAIKSILDQTYSDFEILVIDDGSKDDTHETVNSFDDPRIKYFYKQNSGPSDSRNLGIKNSRGSYITFLDDDDVYLEDKLKLEVELLENNQKLGFCYSNLYTKTSKRSQLTIKSTPTNDYFHLLLTGTGSFVSTQTIMIRKSLVNKVGYFLKRYEPTEDYDFWLRCAKIARFGYIDKPLAVYNLHNKNITGSPKYLFKAISKVRSDHLHNVNKKDVPDNLIEKYDWENNYQNARVYFYGQDRNLSRYYFFRAMKISPLRPEALIYLLQTFLPGHLLIDTNYHLYMLIKY